MAIEIKQIFLDEVLEQIPVFYRYMTEFNTAELGELKVGARFSESKSHFSHSYLQFNFFKPVSEADLSEYFQE